jgi:Chain length determinant protein
MTTTEERPRTQPDLEPEREVDFSRYLDALVARWWLPVAGLIIGAAIGYFLALGGKDVYRAQATVYVGTPYGANGTVLNTPATNPNTVSRIARGQDTLQQVAQSSGMSVRELRAGVSTRPIKSGAPKTAPNQLYAVTVEGPRRGEATAATNAIAERIVTVTGGYARQKIATFKQQIASDQRQLDAIDQQSTQIQAQLNGASSTDRLILSNLLLTMEQRRGTLEQDRFQAREFLAQAEQVELPFVIDRGVAAKATARSARNSVVVAGLIGLIIGLFAALLWEPIAARAGRE